MRINDGINWHRPGRALAAMDEMLFELTSSDATVAVRFSWPELMEVIWFFASESDVTWGNNWSNLEGTRARELLPKSIVSTGFTREKREKLLAMDVSFRFWLAQEKVRVVVLFHLSVCKCKAPVDSRVRQGIYNWWKKKMRKESWPSHRMWRRCRRKISMLHWTTASPDFRILDRYRNPMDLIQLITNEENKLI